MNLYETSITLINPNTGLPVDVTIWVQAQSQQNADKIIKVIQDLSTFTGNAPALRAIAVQLIADIDAQG